jgi:hypothetical protein
MPTRIYPIFAHDYITVTDVPALDDSGAIIGYDYQAADPRARSEFQQAGAGLLNADRNLLFWQRLASRVGITNVARCHGCAAFAAQKLVDRNFHVAHNMSIWICGCADHYFLVLSTSPRVIANYQMKFDTSIFNPTDIVVDLWLYNVLRQKTGRREDSAMAVAIPQYTYIAGSNDIRVFIQYA